MSRSNQQWTEDLRVEQANALADLRESLLRNLQKAFSDRPRADDSFLEDVAQESLMRILEKLDTFKGRSRFLTWATTIAIRVAAGQLRRRRWKDISLEELTAEARFAPQQTIDPGASVAAQSHRSAILGAMHHAIEHELTDRQRTALLAELKGMPQDEIASQLGSTRNAVYKLTHDARKKLKKSLEAVGYSADDVMQSVS